MTELRTIEELPRTLSFATSFNDFSKVLKLTRIKESTALFLISRDRLFLQTISAITCQADTPYSVPPLLDAGQVLGLATRSDTLIVGLLDENSPTGADVVQFSLEGEEGTQNAFLNIAWGNTRIRQRCILARQFVLHVQPSAQSSFTSTTLTHCFRALEQFTRRPPKGHPDPRIVVVDNIAKVYQHPWYAQWEDAELGSPTSLSILSGNVEQLLPALKEWQGDVSVSASQGRLLLSSGSACCVATEGASRIPDVSGLIARGAEAVSLSMPIDEFYSAIFRICSQMPPSSKPTLRIQIDPSASELLLEIVCPDGMASLRRNVKILNEGLGQPRSVTVSASAIHTFSKNCSRDVDIQIRFIDGALIFEQTVNATRRHAILAAEMR